jgi:hypothetical protein
MTNRKSMTAALALALIAPALAHHSSAMYDETKTATVEATIAKVEWENPHITIWAYVSNPQKSGGYELYGIQSGSINLLTRGGWTKTTLKSGEKVTIEYFPLRDGRPGGSLVKAVHADGSVSTGDPLAIGFAELKRRSAAAGQAKSPAEAPQSGGAK